jgi:hypothetical protein
MYCMHTNRYSVYINLSQKTHIKNSNHNPSKTSPSNPSKIAIQPILPISAYNKNTANITINNYGTYHNK